MFDLKNCVNFNGQIYCWNQLTNSIVKIELKSISVKECPETVIETLLKSAYNNSGEKPQE